MKTPSKDPAAVALGRKGGQAKTERKAAAVAANGAKGGRPTRVSVAIQTARNWLAMLANNAPSKGYAVTYYRAFLGHTLDLKKPAAWIPGCIAVPIGGGPIYLTRGGNHKGAKAWLPISGQDTIAPNLNDE